MEIRQIKEFFKINDEFRSPGSGENGKIHSWNDSLKLFEYVVNNALSTAVRETGTNRIEFTLKDGSKVYLSLGALAWLDSVTSAVVSVFGRTGIVVAESGDYSADQVTNAFDKTADTLDDIIEGETNLHFTETDAINLGLNTENRHTHLNKSILDLIEDAGSGQIVTDAERTLWNSYTSTNAEFIRSTIAAFIQNNTGISWSWNELEEKLIPQINLSDFTTDNLPEGTTNKYWNGSNQIGYTINLPNSGTVGGRCSGATETTDYPTGWILAAGSNPNDLEITHNLDRIIAAANVFYVDGTEQILLMANLGYTGLSAPDTNTLVLKGLSTKAFPLIVQLIFT